MRVFALILAFLLFFSSLCFAEVVQLWDGTSVDAQVLCVSSDGAKVKYQGEVILLDWDTMVTNEALRVWEAHIDGSNAQNWFDIGQYAFTHGKRSQAKKFFALAVKIDPSFSDRIPELSDPEADKKAILELLEKASKAENAKKYDLAIELFTQILEWSSSKVLDEVLMDTDFLNKALLQDHVKRLFQQLLASQGYSRMGLRWVSKDERDIREKDLAERDNNNAADMNSNETHAEWDDSYTRNGRWFSIRTNARKWYFKRYIKRLDILYDEFVGLYGFRKVIDQLAAVNVYKSMAEYKAKARELQPGAEELGGFYHDRTIHLFIESDAQDLVYEDLSVMSLNYLAAVLYLQCTCKKVPTWLEVGIGQYFQDSQWLSARKVSIGKAPNRFSLKGFQDGLNSGETLYCQKLLKAQGGLTEFEKYACWAMVTYILEGSGSMKAMFVKCLKKADEDENAFDAFFQKANNLNKEIPEFIETLKNKPNIFEVPVYRMF